MNSRSKRILSFTFLLLISTAFVCNATLPYGHDSFFWADNIETEFELSENQPSELEDSNQYHSLSGTLVTSDTGLDIPSGLHLLKSKSLQKVKSGQPKLYILFHSFRFHC